MASTSSFNGNDLFSSGPHRFALGPQGEYVLLNSRTNPAQAGSVPIGPLELDVIITGRLVAPNESDLWSIRDAIASHLTDPPEIGPLVDLWEREWPDMSFISFTTADRTDRGREVSIAYTAIFRKFA